MTAKVLTLDDIADSITDLASSMTDMETMVMEALGDSETRLRAEMHSMGSDIRAEMHSMGSDIRAEVQATNNELRSGMNSMGNKLFDEIQTSNTRLDALTRSQRQIAEKLEHMDGNLTALDGDVKELYYMLDDLRKDFTSFTAEERQHFTRLDKFAYEVSRQTGIPHEAA